MIGFVKAHGISILILAIGITALVLFLNTLGGRARPTLNASVDVVYVVAVPRRKGYMQKVLKYYNTTGEFIDPVMKDSLDREKAIRDGLLDQNYQNQRSSVIHMKPTPLNNGRSACHLSHMKTLQTFLNSRHRHCLIFEDDIVMKDSQETICIFNKIMSSLPKDWEYINLGRCWDECALEKQINEH